MQKIALITDSASDLTFEQLEKHNIKLAPFKVIYSYGEFEDKIDITPEEVYNSLEKEIPTTSLPGNEHIEKILNEIEKEGYTHVIAVTISSGLSGTGNSIRLLLNEHPNLTSCVIDTRTLSMAEGFVVLEAAKMIENGDSFEKIVEELPKLHDKIHGFFTINTLEYLKKGGRIGKVAGTIGEILNLKPIITVGDDGIYQTFAKVRGRNQSLTRLQKIVKEYIEKSKCRICVLDGGAPEDAEKFYQNIKDYDNIVEIVRAQIGPALGVHTGPGLIGVVVQEV